MVNFNSGINPRLLAFQGSGWRKLSQDKEGSYIYAKQVRSYDNGWSFC